MQFSGCDVCDCISVYIKLTDHQFNACKADQVIEKLAPFEEKSLLVAASTGKNMYGQETHNRQPR